MLIHYLQPSKTGIERRVLLSVERSMILKMFQEPVCDIRTVGYIKLRMELLLYRLKTGEII